MKHPWELPEGWKELGHRFYNVTEGSPGWIHYSSSIHAFCRNSFGVPCFIGYAILATFSLIVLVATILHALETICKHPNIFPSRLTQMLRRYFTEVPLFGTKHATPTPIIGKYVNVKTPLRMEAFFLAMLFAANIASIVGFYTPYTSNNLYWPDQTFAQVARYVSDRSGIMATVQLVPIILLSGRNNPITFLTGASFSTCMLYHRWFARFFFLQVLVHGSGYTFLILQNGGWKHYTDVWAKFYFQMGSLAALAFTILTFLSIRWFREKSYEWFVLIHIVFAMVCLVGVFYHIKPLNHTGQLADFIYCVYASTALWVFDRTVRHFQILYMNFSFKRNEGFSLPVGRVSFLPDIENGRTRVLVIEVEVFGRAAKRIMKSPLLRAAGRSAQLWIPRIQPHASHPFSIADVVQRPDSVVLRIYARVHEGMTGRLARKVDEAGGSIELFMLLEGFYGEDLHLQKYESQIILAGGIGITHCLPYLKSAMHLHQEAHLIWMVRDLSLLPIAISALEDLADTSRLAFEDSTSEDKTRRGRATLSIYVTRQRRKSDEFRKSLFDDEDTLLLLPALPDGAGEDDDRDPGGSLASCSRDCASPESSCDDSCYPPESEDILAGIRPMLQHALDIHVYYLARRPDIAGIVRQEVQQSCASGPEKMIALSCGPEGFVDAVRDAVRKEGIRYAEEGFGW